MKRRIIALGALAALAGAALIYVCAMPTHDGHGPFGGAPTVVKDAKHLAWLCFIFEQEIAPGETGRVISLDDALSMADPETQAYLRKRIEDRVLIFLEPSIPIVENRVVAIAYMEDGIAIINGMTYSQGYRRE